MLKEQQVKIGVLEGPVPSAAWDAEFTYHEGMIGDPFIQTKKRSTNIFALADGHPTHETNTSMLEHRLIYPAHTINMVLTLANQSLLSGGKKSEAGYVFVCDGDEVNIYDGQTAKITVSKKAALKGWRCPCTRLWQITIQA